MTATLTLIVCGGRNYADRSRLFRVLDRVHHERGISRIVNGGASGADALARQWAKSRGVECVTFPADWSLGRRAGPERNQRMLDAGADGVVAFPGGRGTADMVRRAIAAGVPAWEPC